MDYKELFALAPAEPIVSLDRRIVYEHFILPEDPPQNEKQRERNLYTAKEKIKKEEGKKKLTRADKRRVMRLERDQRRDAGLLERAQAMRGNPINNNILVQALRQQAQPAVQQVGQVQPQGARIQMIDDNDVIRAVENIDPGTRKMKFWDIIARFNWHNASDGAMPARPVIAVFEALSAVDLLIFKKEYENVFTGAMAFLIADGMFERNNINDLRSRARVVSHIIALGENQFATLMDDPAFLQFLIEARECQSLDDLMPDDIKVA